ncbi:hypothetical protein BL253_18240 [Pseudofrankia asymbiotica]|uniref:Uncharacterized protein n=1 Tax=Pseudofrankia asymbiotica TaxID=1834516 RepID=A0A1V2IAW1_9ACTN|nr:hypothetical protein BL253_18240 [Pseudofrankia asymbiotica]
MTEGGDDDGGAPTDSARRRLAPAMREGTAHPRKAGAAPTEGPAHDAAVTSVRSLPRCLPRRGGLIKIKETIFVMLWEVL